MKYYTVADTHGFLQPLLKALEDAGYFQDKGEKRLVLCGDALDRGGEAVALTEFLLKEHDAGRLIYIKGNHEELLVDALTAIARGEIVEVASEWSIHTHNGTWGTILQLSGMTEAMAIKYPLEAVARVRSSDYYDRLLPTCVDYYETERYVFCHGWLPTKHDQPKAYSTYSYDPNWREADYPEWRCSRWDNGIELALGYGILESGKTVVCGHYRASYGHDKVCGFKTGRHDPFVSEGIIALDATTVISNTVNCVVLEDS